MVDAIKTIKADHGYEGQILTRTPSGMAVLWKEAPEAFREYVGVFSETPQFFHAVRNYMLQFFAKGINTGISGIVRTLEKL